ncbi:MAG: hypothetical protein WAT79_08785 [Saprospiraceae bacterium]
MKNKEKYNLLEESKAFESLNFKQLFNLCFWSIFKQYKINEFYKMLEIGKAAMYAYKDAVKKTKYVG